MPNFTKQAIKTSFIKLLGEMPLSKISVRSIVEDCGINRNSFYYHFADIPSLIEEIIKEDVDALIAKYPTITSMAVYGWLSISRWRTVRRCCTCTIPQAGTSMRPTSCACANML